MFQTFIKKALKMPIKMKHLNLTSENDKSNHHILFCYLCVFFTSLVFGSLSVLVLKIYSLHYQKVITAFRSLVTHKWDMWRTNIHSKCLKTKFLGKYLHLSRISHVQHYTLMNSKIYACCRVLLHLQWNNNCDQIYMFHPFPNILIS